MTQLVLVSRGYDLSALAPRITQAAPELSVHAFGTPEAADAEVAVCWNPPPGALRTLPNLRLVHAVAAGVDNILCDPGFPPVPLCRIVDPAQARGMSEFVLWSVLHFHRGFDRVLANQRDARWDPPDQRPAHACTVGVMGLGEIGLQVARDLAHMGFRVLGWTREPKREAGIESFAGRDALPAFLAQTDVLVCLLPLTAETRGLIDAQLLRQLRPGAKLVHVGRGEHLVSADLLAALREGRLGGAVVDVFEAEPLPADDPLWRAPNLVVTPHMASSAGFDVVAQQIAENVRRMQRGEPLMNQVDVGRGF
ncbi:2-hydroxyacid dehydrogenase [Paraburkholderia caballeronis]|uniref:Glyoxylate/hydroxypyruvate reductase A n=1 Tax=Paraburkholderia caballeronis TaxID=416943 RepID=A0A1H7NYV8_9BURK|nr:glyoxylate/hydroxypyruvate reductase A [Paraburkholderia caballeronis]PXW25470.1 glyoxylate/hydroxypyruvate reductase A [Paraburkholderia caballeronis]PXX01077.1 glyoxylate/hydroxypyruvate reductase A [Paraburkholderia caballeronis]RAJ99570.1 glyoxylate/hydroxypyruvate reductase A [Paraburkholderia caballeronis]SEE36061.1 glyoxylate/hydroxypyruvate reductase A [Paraburkholderia caballeronis]SEL28576.1 glyoxylate/hydroxypyruvate reductase A [Paraburkholderia caballeronis]